jgi:hypothetical protein
VAVGDDVLAVGGGDVDEVHRGGVVAGAAGDRVARAVDGGHAVVAVARVDRVGAAPAVELVGARAALQRVVAVLAAQRVGPVAAAEALRRGGAGQRVGHGAADDRLDVAGHAVVGVAAEHHRVHGRVGVARGVGAVAAAQRVEPGAALQRVGAVAAVQLVGAAAAAQLVVAGAAGQDVLAEAAGQRVVALAAEQLCGRLARGQRVGAVAARDARRQQVREAFRIDQRHGVGTVARVDVERAHAEAEHAAEVAAHLAVRAGGKRRAGLAHEHRPGRVALDHQHVDLAGRRGHLQDAARSDGGGGRERRVGEQEGQDGSEQEAGEHGRSLRSRRRPHIGDFPSPSRSCNNLSNPCTGARPRHRSSTCRSAARPCGRARRGSATAASTTCPHPPPWRCRPSWATTRASRCGARSACSPPA